MTRISISGTTETTSFCRSPVLPHPSFTVENSSYPTHVTPDAMATCLTTLTRLEKLFLSLNPLNLALSKKVDIRLVTHALSFPLLLIFGSKGSLPRSIFSTPAQHVSQISLCNMLTHQSLSVEPKGFAQSHSMAAIRLIHLYALRFLLLKVRAVHRFSSEVLADCFHAILHSFSARNLRTCTCVSCHQAAGQYDPITSGNRGIQTIHILCSDGLL